MKVARVASGAAAFVLACACQLSASPISGTFDIAGTVTATATTISWTNNLSPPTPQKAVIGPSDLSGSFTGLGGTEVTIKDLNNSTEPVGTAFSPQPFISFDAAPTLPGLMINFVYPGIYSSGGCSASPPAVGQTCTPAIPGGSPFNFVNNPPPGSPEATATWVLAGVTSDGSATWTGNFTSQFNVPFQDVLARLAQSGSVSDTYSATFTVTPKSPVPEPESLFLMLGGLVLVSGSYLKKKLL